MPSLEMQWSVGADNQQVCGSSQDPTLGDIIELLPTMLSSTGNITMHVNDAHPGGPLVLEMETERGLIVFSLLQDDTNDNYVRFYSRPISEKHIPELIEIRGNHWISAIVCTDSKVALAIFKEFFDKGDVSTNFLN